MNEKILDALMRLFALITDCGDGRYTQDARNVVCAYLQRLLSSDAVEEYLAKFDRYVDEQGLKDTRKMSERKQVSLNSVRVLKICRQINAELHQKEKFIVLIQLVEYVYTDDIITETETDFVSTVSDSFNISRRDFQNILAFVKNKMNEAADLSDFLFINSDSSSTLGVHHICSQEMDGTIRILYIRPVEEFFFIYSGNQRLQLNNRNIEHDRCVQFGNGGIISGSNIGVIYQNEVASIFLQSESSEHITFAASDISFHYKQCANGLQPFSFYLESGTMVGIMGGSGTGKSTLLNVLTGKYPLHSGTIYFNGVPINEKQHSAAGVIGLVPQDDLLIEELTVYQNLYYNTCLCLGNLPNEEIEAHVNRILADLDLTEIKDLRVGNAINTVISGGQRKRLNIALELVREPLVLFVDEPTSGLSSTDSEMVMQLLKQQAVKGKIVIVNIHQPSSNTFKMFDTLWVMDKGGYVVYNGNPIEAISYFKRMSGMADAGESECPECGNVDSEQILSIIEGKVVNQFGRYTQKRKVQPEEWHNFYNRYLAFDAEPVLPLPVLDLPKEKFKIPSLLRQFGVFCKRDILAKLTNIQYLIITFLEAPLLAFILGFFTKYINDEGNYVFADNKNLPAFLFMVIVVALFTGLTSSAEEIIRDRRILEREKFLNLSRFSYISSKVVIVFSISAVQTLSFVVLGNLILEIDGMTLPYWIVMFSTACAANILGLIISSALDSVIAIYVLIPFILVPQLLLGGAMIDFDDIHESVSDKINVPIIGDLMISRWGYEALMVEQFADNYYEREFFDLDMQKSRCIYLSSFLFPELETITTQCVSLSNNPQKRYDFENMLQIVKNEVEYLNYRDKNFNYNRMETLEPFAFTSKEGLALLNYLEERRQFFVIAADSVNQIREQKITQIQEQFGADYFVNLKQNNYNERLAEYVLNKRAVKKIYFSPAHRLIQKKDPVFMEPVSDCGRAHFFAPVKIILNHKIPTFFFNIMVLWGVSFVLFLLLLFDIPRKTLSMFYIKRKDVLKN
ncbi:MAG: ATP-binding cassette domain-containing protein [Bacteroidales bacterium]|nr:ATP-binding cassette domain-containing protein [Bacteroidales bacterium]MBR4216063.1 ATP-binding cassette domain-containing protein [Bacteroidales bacterium]